MAKIVGEEWISLIITMIVLIVMQYPNGFIAISDTASLFFLHLFVRLRLFRRDAKSHSFRTNNVDFFLLFSF